METTAKKRKNRITIRYLTVDHPTRVQWSEIHIRLLRTVKPQLYTKIKQIAGLKYIKVNTYFGTTF